MLPKEQRLKKNSAFKATYRLKNTYSDKYFILFVGKEKQSLDVPTKVGFVVSKKNHKRAVKRNRIKRLLREAYRTLFLAGEINNVSKYLSLIFVVKNDAIGIDFDAVKTSVKNIIGKIK